MNSNKSVKISLITAALTLMMVAQSMAQFDISADVVSRYVWRGWDFGNSAAVQPGLTYTAELGGGSLEVGAWGSFALNGAANENDLYASFSTGPVSVIVTDYFFPSYAFTSSATKDSLFEFSDKHVQEVGIGLTAGVFTFSGYYNVAGFDKDNSSYFEIAVTPPYDVEGIDLGLFAGAANGAYYTSDGKFALINLGISVSKDMYSASYIVNPDQESSYLVFTFSF